MLMRFDDQKQKLVFGQNFGFFGSKNLTLPYLFSGNKKISTVLDHRRQTTRCDMWPTAFRLRFPKCIFCEAHFCEVYLAYASFASLFINGLPYLRGPLKTDIFPDTGVIEEINVGILLNYKSAKAFIMSWIWPDWHFHWHQVVLQILTVLWRIWLLNSLSRDFSLSLLFNLFQFLGVYYGYLPLSWLMAYFSRLKSFNCVVKSIFLILLFLISAFFQFQFPEVSQRCGNWQFLAQG